MTNMIPMSNSKIPIKCSMYSRLLKGGELLISDKGIKFRNLLLPKTIRIVPKRILQIRVNFEFIAGDFWWLKNILSICYYFVKNKYKFN